MLFQKRNRSIDANGFLLHDGWEKVRPNFQFKTDNKSTKATLNLAIYPTVL